jgi:predicted hydrocarbon binding protein/KaiC/GvpD/RAD55 family RecA-like ATPase
MLRCLEVTKAQEFTNEQQLLDKFVTFTEKLKETLSIRSIGIILSLTQLQEVPPRNMILVVGPPGSGKSTFCHQTVLSNIEMRPVIYVTTESAPSKVIDSLRQKGLGEALPHSLGFVDAFHETVGLPSAARPDTVDASSEDLTSLGIAISKLRERVGENFLLVFDSLTPAYLMSGPEVIRFMRTTLLRLAAEGNAVLACVDEGCGKSEDLVAMMSTADGIVKIELIDGLKTFNIIKHPEVEPTKIEVPMTWSPAIPFHIDAKMLAQHVEMSMGLTAGTPLRTEVGDYVNLFWPNFARWCGMLWDPKRFPTMVYNSTKHSKEALEIIRRLPWIKRVLFKLFIPKNFSKVKDMKKLVSQTAPLLERDRFKITEYLEDASKTNEHYVRGHESATCWGFDNVGATLGLGTFGTWAGNLMIFEKEDRDWNLIETKCIGLGDPYCEAKFVPGEIDELKTSLEAIDNTILERIHNRLMDRLMGFILRGEPLWKERPRLGNDVSLHALGHIMVLPAMASERYRMAMRLGGAMGGKRVGERLMDAGMGEDEVVKCILSLFEYCKVGKVTMGETLRMVQNCESFMTKAEEPSCHFTTGFLNGFFSAVKNQHVKETKCIAMGDPYCEWEFR